MPTCDRTYSDQTLSFCLEDGALLSASFDSEATVEIRSKETGAELTSKGFTKENLAEGALGALASLARKRTAGLEKRRKDRKENPEPELTWRDTLRAMLTFDIFGTGRKKKKK